MNLKQSLYALLLMTSFSGCTSETEFQTNAGGEELTSQSGIRFVIQTPSPDAIVSRVTLPADTEESSVKSMSLYIFAKKAEATGDTDDQYELLKKTEDITFSANGEPGKTGTTGTGGALSYTEPITADMIGRQVKMLLVANDKVTGAQVTATTLDVFKQSAATAQPVGETSSDAISGNIFASDNSSATGLVMSAVAYQGEAEGIGEAVVLTPLGVDMKASFERIVARIDLIHAIPNMTLTGVKILNASSKGYLFKQASTDAPANDGVTLLPTSGYDGKLSPDGITYDGEVPDNNTLKHMFYLYEQTNSLDKCVTVEISYKLKMGNWIKPGKLNVEFKKSDAEDGGYVNTVRNTLYTIQMGNGEEAIDVNNVTTIKVLDWNLENEIEEPFTPDEDSHSEIITDPAEAKIGDFYMADGTLRRSDYKFMESEKSQVIGVVFQTYADAPGRFGEAEKQALREKGVDTPHGLVMAVKLATPERIAWGPQLETSSLEYKNTIELRYKDISGLSNWNIIKELNDDFSNYPAFKVVVDFENKIPAPNASTGWFLPSSGQWWDIVANLGGLGEYMSEPIGNMYQYYHWYYSTDLPEDVPGNVGYKSIGNVGEYYVQKKLNESLKSIGECADLFQIVTHLYWTSSKGSDVCACNVYFTATSFCSHENAFNTLHSVRPVLAF